MTNEELLAELESLVSALEESFAIIAGTVAENADAGRTLKHLLAGAHATEQRIGPNGWRDRLLRSSLKIVALKARPQSSNDPELQSLIASVLAGRQESDPEH